MKKEQPGGIGNHGRIAINHNSAGNSCTGDAIIIPVMPINPEYATAISGIKPMANLHSRGGLKAGNHLPRTQDHWVN